MIRPPPGLCAPAEGDSDVVETRYKPGGPFRLAVTGESRSWLPAVARLVGPRWVQPRPVDSDEGLIELVHDHEADAVVLDDEVPWSADVIRLLRIIRRLDARLPVVVVTGQRDRHVLQAMLDLRAYSVLGRPVELEQLLRQIHGMMVRLDRVLRSGRQAHEQ